MNCICSLYFFQYTYIYVLFTLWTNPHALSFHTSVHHSPLALTITIFPPSNHGWILHWEYNTASFSTTLHHSLLHCIILYHTASFSTTLHHFLALHHSLQYCIILYHTASFSTTLHHYLQPWIILYHTASFSTTLHHSLLHRIIFYNTASFFTTVHPSLLHCISFYNTALQNSPLHNKYKSKPHSSILQHTTLHQATAEYRGLGCRVLFSN